MNKKAIILITVVALLLFFGAWQYKKSNDSSLPNINQTLVTNNINNPLAKNDTVKNNNTPVKVNKNTSTNTSVNKTLTYGEAVNTYKNRIQFVQCNGVINTPTIHSISIVRNSQMMLDNRDPAAHTIVVQNLSYKIGAYSFTIVTPKNTGTSTITCDGRKAATLNVN